MTDKSKEMDKLLQDELNDYLNKLKEASAEKRLSDFEKALEKEEVLNKLIKQGIIKDNSI